MRILIIQSWIKLGGAELISVEMAHELGNQGQEVAIAATFLDTGGMPNNATSVRYVVPAAWLQHILARSRLAFLLAGPWVLLALVWKYSRRVDVLNPHNFPSSWVAAIVGGLRRIPVIWTCNEPPEAPAWRDASRIGLADYMGWHIASSWLDKVMVKRIQRIYVPSERTRRQVQARYGREATVIRIGVDLKYYRREEATFPTELANEDGGSFIMLAVGKLHPQKNQIVCLDALKLVLPHIPNAILVLAGDGPMSAQWRQHAASIGVDEHVRFLGRVPSARVGGLYRRSNVNLFPALNQSWGFTPFEALCSDRISIVSEECGAAELLRREGIGLVCAPTPEEFAESVRVVHDNPNVYRQKAIKGREFVLRHLTWKQYCMAFLDLAVGLIDRADRSQGDRAGIGEVPA